MIKINLIRIFVLIIVYQIENKTKITLNMEGSTKKLN